MIYALTLCLPTDAEYLRGQDMNGRQLRKRPRDEFEFNGGIEEARRAAHAAQAAMEAARLDAERVQVQNLLLPGGMDALRTLVEIINGFREYYDIDPVCLNYRLTRAALEHTIHPGQTITHRARTAGYDLAGGVVEHFEESVTVNSMVEDLLGRVDEMTDNEEEYDDEFLPVSWLLNDAVVLGIGFHQGDEMTHWAFIFGYNPEEVRNCI